MNPHTKTAETAAMYILTDTFSGTRLSRHRSIRAAVVAKHKRTRLVRSMPSGPHGRPFLPMTIMRERGPWTAADAAEMFRVLSVLGC